MKFIDEFKNEWEVKEDGTYELIKEVEFAEFCKPTPEYIKHRSNLKLEQKKQSIYTELAELDKVVSREYENTYQAYETLLVSNIIPTNPLYWSDKMQEAVDKKIILRNQL